ncbi:hypothetical protein X729_05610 [Mesorhizobium sp. L103C131B0]|nr:hypothetical protein X729_05610 [Mesorhizobium sp. L103C131B0]
MANELAVYVFWLLARDEHSLLPVATTTWEYISGIGRSFGFMHSSVIE